MIIILFYFRRLTIYVKEVPVVSIIFDQFFLPSFKKTSIFLNKNFSGTLFHQFFVSSIPRNIPQDIPFPQPETHLRLTSPYPFLPLPSSLIPSFRSLSDRSIFKSWSLVLEETLYKTILVMIKERRTIPAIH